VNRADWLGQHLENSVRFVIKAAEVVGSSRDTSPCSPCIRSSSTISIGGILQRVIACLQDDMEAGAPGVDYCCCVRLAHFS
jgi:hypothetical protein